MKEITLKEHLTKIAKQRHKDLKAKLGKVGYSKYMQRISLARFTKKGKKLSTDGS